MKKVIFGVLAALLLGVTYFGQSNLQQGVSPLSHVGGKFYASAYNTWQAKIKTGNSATGSGNTITISGPTPLQDGTFVAPQVLFNPSALSPITIADNNAETVTPTGISFAACNEEFGQTCTTITGNFSSLHGGGAIVVSGTYGLGEAINHASAIAGVGNGYGGVVVVDPTWTSLGGTSSTISGLSVFNAAISIEDDRAGPSRFWSVTPTGAALGVPTTLTAQAACDATHQFCSDATVAGSASWGGALYGCVAYVDIAGNEGPCSLTSTVFTSVASKAIDIASPAASTGAVGWVPYLSLSGGTYAQAYQLPVTSALCTLTTLETVTPACAVANSTYNQATSTFGAGGLFTKGGAQFTGYPLNTSMHFTKLASVAMTAASLTPVSNSSVSYAFAPSNRVGACAGISSANVVNYAAAGSSATTIPNAIATWTVPASCFNYVGAEFRVSGKFTFTDGGDSSTEVRVGWDSALADSTTIPTTLCSMVDTATGTGAAYNGTYFCTIKTATTGTTGTALVNGYANLKLAAGATTLVRDTTDVAVAPSAATVNWTAPARIVVYFIGTGATNNPGAQGLAATLEVLN